MKMIKLPLYMCLFLLCQSKVDTQQAIIQEVISKYNNITSLVSDYEYFWLEDGEQKLLAGKCVYKKPRRMRLDLTDGQASFVYIRNRDRQLTYDPEFNLVILFDPLNGGKENLFKYYDVNGLLKSMDFEKIEETTINEKAAYLFTYKGKKTIKLYVDRKIGLMFKLEIFDDSDKLLMRIKYDNYQIDVPIDDKLFDFKITDDMQVMDWTTSDSSSDR